MPDEWTEQDLKQHFEAFGKISSFICGKNAIGKFAFICYGSED